MWIPYDLRGLLVAEPRGPSARAAEADTSLRPFFVGIWLKNPVTQHWETDLSLPTDLPSTTSAGPLGPVDITFQANDAGRLSEVICHLEAHSPAQAVEISLALVQPRFLAMGARVGRGMNLAAWQVMDVNHAQRFRASPNRPSTLDAHADWFTLAPPADLIPAMLLCQRSRAASDAASRLVAAASALNHMLSSPAFAAAVAARLRISAQTLLHSATLGACDELEGMGFDEFLTHLHQAVAKLMQPDGLWAPLPLEEVDTPRIAALANLADLVAHRLMSSELRIRDSQSHPAAETIA